MVLEESFNVLRILGRMKMETHPYTAIGLAKVREMRWRHDDDLFLSFYLKESLKRKS